MFGRWKKQPEPAPEPEQEDEAPAAHAVKTQAEIGLTFARRLDDPDENREEQLAYARRAIERCLWVSLRSRTTTTRALPPT